MCKSAVGIAHHALVLGQLKTSNIICNLLGTGDTHNNTVFSMAANCLVNVPATEPQLVPLLCTAGDMHDFVKRTD